MRRDELAHVLRAAATITGDGHILVVGSQAILGSHSEDELPEEAWISVEADLVFLDPDTGPDKAEQGTAPSASCLSSTRSSATTRKVWT